MKIELDTETAILKAGDTTYFGLDIPGSTCVDCWFQGICEGSDMVESLASSYCAQQKNSFIWVRDKLVITKQKVSDYLGVEPELIELVNEDK